MNADTTMQTTTQNTASLKATATVQNQKECYTLRPDIARLTVQNLSYIANKGVVKRALKALQQGDVPTLTFDDDRRLTAYFYDNPKDAPSTASPTATLTWQIQQGIYDSVCTCPASSHVLCRHQVQTALYYHQQYCKYYDIHAITAPPAHQITLKQIRQALTANNKRTLKALNKSSVTVVLSHSAKDPCAIARLPMATVHFWGGNALYEATCDCHIKIGCEHILLAAMAFLAHNKPVTTSVTVSISKALMLSYINNKDTNAKTKKAKTVTTQTSNTSKKLTAKSGASQPPYAKAATNSGTDKQNNNPIDSMQVRNNTNPSSMLKFTYASLDITPESLAEISPKQLWAQLAVLLTVSEKKLFTQLFRYGIGGAQTVTQALIDDIKHDNKRKQHVWLNETLQALTDWLLAYQIRRSDFYLQQGVAIIAEYLSRRLAGRQADMASASLGVGVPAQTAVRPTQLLSLGCHIDVAGPIYRAQTLLLDKKSHSPLLLQTTWQPVEPNFTNSNQTADENTLAARYDAVRAKLIAPKVKLAALQQGVLTVQRAKRTANHSISLNKARHAYNQLMPYTIDRKELTTLPPPLRFESIDQLRQHYLSRPLSFARPRYQQPDFLILPIGKLLYIGYDPALQMVGALIQLGAGSTVKSAPSVGKTSERIKDCYWIKLAYRAHTPFTLAILIEALAPLVTMPTGVLKPDSIDADNEISKKDDTNKMPQNLAHHVSGTLSWEQFEDKLYPVITPWALFNEIGITVPALDKPTQDTQKEESTQKPHTPARLDSPLPEKLSLSTLPIADFALDDYQTTGVSVSSVLQDCQNWLTDALIYGLDNVPTQFWQEQRKLIARAKYVGLTHLAEALTNSLSSRQDSHNKHDTHNNEESLHPSQQIICCCIQLGVIREIAVLQQLTMII